MAEEARAPRGEEARTDRWFKRIRAANKVHKKWMERFKVKNLEEYYLGKQWRGVEDEEAQKRYVINLVFSTIETNKPSLIFNNPQVKMDVRPGKQDDLSTAAADRAKLCQDTVQTFVDDPDQEFVPTTSLALHETHFAYGVVEVGYTPDWIDNPNAGKPVLEEKDQKDDPDIEVRDKENQPVLEPMRLLTQEFLFIKHIPADQFRVSASNKNSLKQNDWVGYYEWHYVEDIKRNPVYAKKARGLKAQGAIQADQSEMDTLESNEEREKHEGMVKVWKLWDQRTLTKLVLAEGHPRVLYEEEFKYSPFAVLKWYEVLKSFYPCPPVFQWLGPQDEVNETRDSQRAHRRRFYRRYTVMRNSVEPEELEKLETGGDGTYIQVDQPNPITPVPDAPLSSDVWQHLDESKNDFLTVSGVSGDQRGVAESETATQANIINTHAQLRESAIRGKVQNWLADICRLILLTIRDNMALPIWIQRNVDLGTPDAESKLTESMRVAQRWKEITSDELGDTDYDINIDVSSMSPVSQEMEKVNWSNILALLSNPSLCMILSQSPTLLRKTLALYGIKTEREIMEIQKVMTFVVMTNVAMAAAGGAGKDAGPKGTPPPAKKKAQGETPAEAKGTVQ